MNKIATLGPKGTFCEIACNKYIEKSKENGDIVFYSTIKKVCNAALKECDMAIIPAENTLDGHVQVSLDLLLEMDLKIIYEIIIPIQFAFISNSLNILDAKKVYAQFKTQGQCTYFIEQLDDDVKIITTESNGESLRQVKRGITGESAIIPRHALKCNDNFPLSIDNVTDSKENETRFFVLSKDSIDYNRKKKYKTAIVILNAVDEPGALFKILNEFSKKSVNLSSIMSRPTKKALGKYFFFMEIDGNYPKDKDIKEAIDLIKETNIVKVLGSYWVI